MVQTHIRLQTPELIRHPSSQTDMDTPKLQNSHGFLQMELSCDLFPEG